MLLSPIYRGRVTAESGGRIAVRAHVQPTDSVGSIAITASLLGPNGSSLKPISAGPLVAPSHRRQWQAPPKIMLVHISLPIGFLRQKWTRAGWSAELILATSAGIGPATANRPVLLCYRCSDSPRAGAHIHAGGHLPERLSTVLSVRHTVFQHHAG